MDWFEKHRIITVTIAMLIIWFSLLAFFWIKADEITKDPCSICSERYEDKIICRDIYGNSINIEYYPNGTKIETRWVNSLLTSDLR